MAKIWIVEDDPKIGLLISMAMQKAGHETLHLLDAAELERALKREKRLPELLLLDLMLRAKSGFEVLSEWKADVATRDIPVIILSARSAERDKVRGLELGAEDYITKPFGVRELQARVQTALRRLPSPDDRIDVGGLSIRPSTREVRVDGARVDLTAREFDLLLYLARRAGANVTRAALLRDVWGYATDDDTSRTVDSHIKSLRVRLGDDAARPRFIHTVRGAGYRLAAEDMP